MMDARVSLSNTHLHDVWVFNFGTQYTGDCHLFSVSETLEYEDTYPISDGKVVNT